MNTSKMLIVLALPGMLLASVDTAWVRRYDGPRHGADWATCLAVDSLGNVYVAGPSAADTGYANLDFLTIKYRPNGDTAWVRRRDFSYGNDQPCGLGVDNEGNVYVTGSSNNRVGATIKYDSTGRLQWTRLFGTQALLDGLALDPQGNIVVCGGETQASLDCITIKYRPDGDTAWVRRYDWAGYDDDLDALVLTSRGDVNVVGFSSDTSSGGNILALRYDSAGNRLWASYYDGPQHGADWPSAIAADREGNSVVAGVSDGGAETHLDYITVRYDLSGETLWTRRYNGTAGERDKAEAVASDREGNAFVTGYARDSSTDDDCITIKYRPDGSVAWLARYDGPARSGDGAHAVTVDEAGRAYITGGSKAPQTLTDCICICYDTCGETVWTMRYNSPANWAEHTTAIALGSDGAVCVAGTGYTAGSASTDMLTIKYTQNGGVAERPRSSTPWLAVGALPNPVTSRTTIRLGLPREGAVLVQVLDVSGRVVRTLHHGQLPDGRHSKVWDRTDNQGARVPAGVYMVVLDACGASARVKVTVLE